jgi:hypothetical protein
LIQFDVSQRSIGRARSQSKTAKLIASDGSLNSLFSGNDATTKTSPC